MRDYLRAFGVYAVYITADRRAHAAAVPTGNIVSIMWTSPRGARAIATRLNKGKFRTIEGAAAALRIRVTPHSDILKHAEGPVRKVNAALAHAKANGELQVFHDAFAEYRRQAAAQGVRAQSYGRAYTRLRAALFVHAANNEPMPPISKVVPTVIGTVPTAKIRARRSRGRPRRE